MSLISVRNPKFTRLFRGEPRSCHPSSLREASGTPWSPPAAFRCERINALLRMAVVVKTVLVDPILVGTSR